MKKNIKIESKEKEDIMDRAYGAILGACCGDAAGAVLEHLNQIPNHFHLNAAMSMSGGGHHKVAPGQITDDGELTISLARGLTKCNGVYDPNKPAEEYALWYRSQPFDVGTTTFQSIGAAVRGESNQKYKKDILEGKGYAYAMNWGATSGEAKFSKANGSLMRATPLGVFGHHLPPSSLAEIARSDSSTTHPHETCQLCVACYSIAIAHLINHPADHLGAFNVAKSWLISVNKDSEVCGWLTDAENGSPVEFYPNAGFIKVGFILAFRHLLKQTAYADAIAETIAGGGDTDTNACIVGGMLGALHGAEKIPEEMKNPVLFCNTQLGRPRPDFLHPKHILSLTEVLMQTAPLPS